MKLRFKPPLLATMATVFVVFVFISLGKWQLRQADNKAAIVATHEKNQLQPAVPVQQLLDDASAAQNNRRVALRGAALPQRQFLLDNKVFQGQVGFDVLTPFVLEDGAGIVLLDRGWRRLGAKRSDLPEVHLPAQTMDIEGSVYVGEKGFTLGGMDEGEQGWPRIIQYLDYERLSQILGGTVLPFVVRLDADHPHAYTTRARPVVTIMPDKHRAYAFQWFALAAAVLLLFFFLNIKRKRNDD